MNGQRKCPGCATGGVYPHMAACDLYDPSRLTTGDPVNDTPEDDPWASPENPLSAALKAHRFQEIQPPGLYPSQPTVCSCGASPNSAPDGEDGDYEWWIDHVKANI